MFQTTSVAWVGNVVNAAVRYLKIIIRGGRATRNRRSDAYAAARVFASVQVVGLNDWDPPTYAPVIRGPLYFTESDDGDAYLGERSKKPKSWNWQQWRKQQWQWWKIQEL